jgi:hypothetical protein
MKNLVQFVLSQVKDMLNGVMYHEFNMEYSSEFGSITEVLSQLSDSLIDVGYSTDDELYKTIRKKLFTLTELFGEEPDNDFEYYHTWSRDEDDIQSDIENLVDEILSLLRRDKKSFEIINTAAAETALKFAGERVMAVNNAIVAELQLKAKGAPVQAQEETVIVDDPNLAVKLELLAMANEKEYAKEWQEKMRHPNNDMGVSPV